MNHLEYYNNMDDASLVKAASQSHKYEPKVAKIIIEIAQRRGLLDERLEITPVGKVEVYHQEMVKSGIKKEGSRILRNTIIVLIATPIVFLICSAAMGGLAQEFGVIKISVVIGVIFLILLVRYILKNYNNDIDIS